MNIEELLSRFKVTKEYTDKVEKMTPEEMCAVCPRRDEDRCPEQCKGARRVNR